MSADYVPTVRNVLALYRWAKNPATPPGQLVQIDWMTRYTPAQALAFLHRCAQTRINLGLPLRMTKRDHDAAEARGYRPLGRKWAEQYQYGLMRDADMIRRWRNERIVPHRRCDTPELQRRFGPMLDKYFAGRDC